MLYLYNSEERIQRWWRIILDSWSQTKVSRKHKRLNIKVSSHNFMTSWRYDFITEAGPDLDVMTLSSAYVFMMTLWVINMSWSDADSCILLYRLWRKQPFRLHINFHFHTLFFLTKANNATFWLHNVSHAQ